jgi:hypothetical protein
MRLRRLVLLVRIRLDWVPVLAPDPLVRTPVLRR